MYFEIPHYDWECSDVINALPINDSIECTSAASKQLRPVSLSNRFVMEVNKTDLPKGCILSAIHRTIWWNRNDQSTTAHSSQFYRVCKYRKFLFLILFHNNV